MTREQAAAVGRGVPGATEDRTGEGRGDAFSTAFDGEPTVGMDAYVRLVPPADDDPATDLDRPIGMPPGSSATAMMFQPHDIERREYRLLARALTNEDDATDHLAAMTLVQLVKFLRAAGVSVPHFPETPETPDPGAIHESVVRADQVDSGPS